MDVVVTLVQLDVSIIDWLHNIATPAFQLKIISLLCWRKYLKCKTMWEGFWVATGESREMNYSWLDANLTLKGGLGKKNIIELL